MLVLYTHSRQTAPDGARRAGFFADRPGDRVHLTRASPRRSWRRCPPNPSESQPTMTARILRDRRARCKNGRRAIALLVACLLLGPSAAGDRWRRGAKTARIAR